MTRPSEVGEMKLSCFSAVTPFALVDGLAQGLVNVLGQPFLHHIVVEHRAAEQLGNIFAVF